MHLNLYFGYSHHNSMSIIQTKKTMETKGQRTKIFISSINSRLGYHFVETFRDDHLYLQNHSFIVGSQRESEGHYHQSIHGLVRFKDNPTLLGKAIIQSNVILLDMREATQEIEYILKILKWKYESRMSGQNSENNNVIVLGIGNHMTWAHEKQQPSRIQNFESSKVMSSKVVGSQSIKQEKVSDSDRNKRICHHSWNKERILEQKLIQLNKYKGLRSCLITTGLIYGKDFPAQEIQALFFRAYSPYKQLHIYGEGNNTLPTTYIQDLCQNLLTTLEILKQRDNEYSNYTISVDQNLHTQLEIVQQLLKNSGNVKEIVRYPLCFITKYQALLSHSLHLRSSEIFNLNRTQNSSFLAYFRHKYQEIFENIDLKPTHYILYTMEEDPQFVTQVQRDLRTVIQLFRQEDLRIEISQRKNIGKQQVDIHELSSAIENCFLTPHQTQNYVLVVNQILLDVSVIKQYNLKKLEIQKDLSLLLGHKYPKYLTEETQMQMVKGNDGVSKNNLDFPQQKQSCRENTQTKRGEGYKIDQYLLDNVIGYLSRAFFNVRQNPTLINFIGNLKQIYEEQLKDAKK